MSSGAALGAALSPAQRTQARFALLLWPLLVTCFCCFHSAWAQELPTNGVHGYSLHPPYFNLAESTKITATATCGEDDTGRSVQDLYCKLVGGPVSGDPSQTIQGQYCDICSHGDSDRAHPITNAIDGTERWWQSPPLSRNTDYNQVNVTLDLGQVFHVAYVLIKFANSPRPDLWVLERSVDFGQTYQPWQYFASSKRDCIERFGQRTIERISNDNDIVCTTEYSRIVPLENGEVVVSLVNGRPGAMNFSYSPVLRDFTKATNIRLRFLRTNTLLGHLMGKALRDPHLLFLFLQYYYSIKDISIGGRCVCNGHAEACNAKDPNDPYKLQCDCQHNTCGLSCGQCCPGYNQLPWKPATTYSANECEPCNCHRHSFDCYYDPEVDQQRGSMDVHGHHRGGGVCLNCQHHTTGANCERCIPTYYRSPDHAIDSPLACSRCDCQSEFTDGTCEDLTGRCFCKPNYAGEDCRSCASGLENFPDCYRDTVGSLPEGCDASGRCLCKPEFQGPRCEQCRSGFHSYPNCQACQCSAQGSRYTSCDQGTGQCVCLPNVLGLRCDSCAHGTYGFPNCQAGTCHPAGSVQYGQCECRGHVEGPACDTCKALYWNLSPDTPDGCTNCECNVAGTVSGVAECAQESGQCHCKPNACSGTCSTCKDGYYNLQEHNYFGCQGCQCDMGGSAGQSCGERNGRCRCRPNVEGPQYHYFPDLHHLKFEIEEGSVLDGRPVRFGYNPLEFPDFSWRGYAQMSPIQSKVLVSVSVSSPDLFHVVLRYANRGGSDMRGRVSVIEDAWNYYCSEQSKQIVFAPSAEPTFVNVPQNNFVEPFVLNPGTWTVVIEAEGILLDYLVLLPSAYYEAPILQIRVTEPCTYSSTHDGGNGPFLPAPPILCILLIKSVFLCLQHKVYLVPREQFTMEYVEPKVHCITVYSTRVHALGRYVFILHYHQPLHPNYPVQVYINGGRIWQGQANASFCPHAYGCRNVLVSENQIILDVTDHELFLTVQIPAGRTLWLDYVLVVPETSYSSSYLNEEPLDKSYDFISNCGQNSFYINPSTASPFCLGSAVSLSAFFNNGAMPCACHEVGAQSDTCEPFGGQCHCRPNVIGRDCSMCATGFWGFPNCRPCNCGTRLCEPVTGDCICPPRTVLPECTQCEPQTFGCHPVVGCEVCNCSRPGVLSPDVNCDTLSGQCRCKNNVVGRQCDRCAPGFYGYPNCRPCDCNEAGTEEEVCDSFTGQCLCKENVQGSRCDQCRVGTFHLDPTNPKGCTSCFCFGATDRCRSSDKRRIEVMNMEGWVLLSADRQEVPVAVYPDQDLVEADLSDVPDVYQDLHWHAPKTYLGDKVSSYGGYLRYRLHTQTMRGDVILGGIGGVSHTGICIGTSQLCSSPYFLSSQGSFRHAQTGNSVSREELMMVLVGLESLQIRALHSQSAHSVSLRGAVLEAADNLPAGRHANNVEICMCPANYLGDSCQKCAPGYYRDTIGLFLGKCVPCNCNGHSDRCLDGSGICLNCQHNTAGDHCESCLGGFLGNNSLDGQAVACSSCPCPLRVPFAEGCVQKVDRMQCLCMPGYAGPHCERCAPGYYGNPMVLGSRCQLCHCHGNTDPNMLFTDCHPLTGECLGCMHDTAGPHCDICAPGYYGDAITAKNCTSEFSLELSTATVHEMQIKMNAIPGNIFHNRLQENDVQHLALADSKIPLVEEAEKHAELLNALAMNLLVAETTKGGFVDVTKAYNNIINSIKEAEEAAKMADKAANATLEVQDAWACLFFCLTSAHACTNENCLKNGLVIFVCVFTSSHFLSTVHVLGETIPLLMKKLDKLQNHSAQMPNISENISRIRQLIQQARNAASKVSVSVKFNGQSGVQVRTPPNLADLAAYTSLKFYITLPEAARARRQDNSDKQFVFYLGNKDVSISTATQKLITCCFVQYLMMNLFLEFIISKMCIAGGDQGLLNLLTDDTVFYVGGYPSTFNPPSQLALPNFKGCIELDTLNEEVLSLYNFENIFQLNTTEDVPCGRSVHTVVAREAHFSGQSYLDMALTNIPTLTNNFYASFSFRTEQTEGLMFYHHDQVGRASQLFPFPLFSLIHSCLSRSITCKSIYHNVFLIAALVHGISKYRLLACCVLTSGCRLCTGGSSISDPLSLPARPHISMAVRINSSDGLVLYAAGGQRGAAVMSLSVSDGHLLIVFLKREGEKMSLIVDGISAQSKRFPGGDRTRLAGPLYVGGVPPSLMVRHPDHAPGSGGFIGCVRDLTLNQAPAGSPAHSKGTVPCFQNPLQPGAYFSGQGGHIAIGTYPHSSPFTHELHRKLFPIEEKVPLYVTGSPICSGVRILFRRLEASLGD
uniref:Laminin, alpha 5 n=1 Tax=Sander lucioperca TaxID=283035 RepID=A0A8C9YW11_SANLU